MKPIEELMSELDLNETQATGVKEYINELLINLLESIKQDHIKNFDETINDLKNN